MIFVLRRRASCILMRTVMGGKGYFYIINVFLEEILVCQLLLPNESKL